jgi:hypothetical protein
MELTPSQIKATADARARAAARASQAQQEPSGPTVVQENATSEARSRADYAADPSTLKDTVRGGASGLTEGTAALLGTPRMVGDLNAKAGNWLMEKAGISEPWRKGISEGVSTAWSSLPVLGLMANGPEGRDITKGMSDLTGGYTEYTPQTYLGSTAKEIGVLAPTALSIAATGGASAIPRGLMYGAALPGVLGTGAEKGATVLAEKAGLDNPEMYGTGAKLAAELLSPGSAKFVLGAPSKGITPHAETAAENLKRSAGIDLTVGEMTHDAATLQREARAIGFDSKTATRHEKLKDFIFKKAGFDRTPSVAEFKAAKDATGASIEKVISDALPTYRIDPSEVNSIVGNRGLMDAIDYAGDPGTKASLDWMVKQVQSGAPLSAAEINQLRSSAWKLSVDPALNIPAKSAAVAFGNFFDKIIADRLKEARQFPALLAYKAAREKYANFVLIDGAIQQSGAPSRMTFSPADLAIASHSVPGASDKMKTVIDDAVSYMLQHSPNQAARVSGHAEGLANTLGNLGMQATMGSPIVAGTQAAIKAGSTLSRILHPLAMTKAGQAIMRRGAANANASSLPLMAPAAMSAVSDVQQNYPIARKSGGRVSKHEADADQLVRAAERAKKGWSAKTEPLLNHSDDAVAKALEVANRSI